MTFDQVIELLAKHRNDDIGPPVFIVTGRLGVGHRFVGFQEGTCDSCNGVGAFHEQELDSEGDVVDLTVECEDCDGYGERETGLVQLHAIGDNHIIAVDPTELTVHFGDVCSCGQIGCEWH